MSVYDGLTNGEKEWLLAENQFVGSAFELLKKRNQYVVNVEKALFEGEPLELEVQLFREQQLASAFTFLEKLTSEAGYLLAKIYGQSIMPKHIAGHYSILQTTRKYLKLVSGVEFPPKDLWDNLLKYRNLRNTMIHGGVLKHTKHGVPAHQVPGLISPEPGIWTLSDSFWPALKEMMEAYTKELIIEIVWNYRKTNPIFFAQKYGGVDDSRSW